MIVEGDIHISSCYRVEDLLDCSRETEDRFRGEVTDDIENIRFNNIKTKAQLEDDVFTNHVTIMLEKSMNLCGELNHDLMMIDGKMCTGFCKAKMKLIVKLPLRRKSERLTKSTNNQDKDENENKKPSKERVRLFRERLKHNSKKLAKYKNKKKQENKTYKAKIKAERKENHDIDEMVKERQRIWKQKSRKLEAKKKKLQKTSEDKDTTSITKNKRRTIQVTQASTRKRVQRVRQLLPESPGAWANTVSHLIKNATPRRKSKLMSFSSTAGKSADLEKIQETLQINKVGRPTREIRNAKKHLAFSSSEQLWKNGKILDMYKKRKLQQVKRLSKPVQFRQQWRGKLEDFLEENSRVMPNRKDTVLIDGKRVAKRHLLSSKLETYKKFKRQNNNFKRKFTTFNKMIPKNFKCLNLSCRRVCICTKDYNMEQKVDALNRKMSIQRGYALIENATAVELIRSRSDYFEPLITHTSSSNNDVLKYNQWETRPESYTNRDGESRKTSRWMQVEKKERTEEVVKNIEEAMESYTGHIFRAKFQNRTQASLIATLPIDHCLVVMDYSENMTLQPQDEIESAHFTQKQITLFPIYIVRYSSESTNENPVLSKESLVILSDHLVHNASAVYIFTNQLLIYLRNSPGPSVKVIHRFSDNCATQFKCKDAFSHLFLLEDKYDIKINYHYTEAGHGKGPSDGIGAGI
ncbi:unnamed protein product [Mytilus edulis]|uniref:Uncharacterized protein n=2 Tax=Mytilus edulis TaxID=6550 RepID=A0A8S3TNM2_MYTED|nr:unnamed protein product [Mytilus edulis]